MPSATDASKNARVATAGKSCISSLFPTASADDATASASLYEASIRYPTFERIAQPNGVYNEISTILY